MARHRRRPTDDEDDLPPARVNADSLREALHLAGYLAPYRWKFAAVLVVVGAAFVALPLAIAPGGTLAAQYRSWYVLGAVDAQDGTEGSELEPADEQLAVGGIVGVAGDEAADIGGPVGDAGQ